jgi:hypothetical protein
MDVQDLSQVMAQLWPHVSAAISAYGTSVVTRVQDAAADATTGTGLGVARKALRKILARDTHGEVTVALENLAEQPEDVERQERAQESILKIIGSDATIFRDIERLVQGGQHSIAANEEGSIAAEQIVGPAITGDAAQVSFHIGGQGGKDGGGGGGGGAIGPGAQGGQGGHAEMHIELDGEEGQGPGSGGGGGGYLDFAAVAWSQHEHQHESEGVGGIFGFDGLDGGDTLFAGLVAPGGQGGLHGDGVRSVSERIKVSSFMACNHGEIRDGLLFVSGGSWTSQSILNLPATVQIPLALVFEVGGVAPGDYTFAIDAINPRGVVSRLVKAPLTVQRLGTVCRVPFLFAPTVTWTTYGVWTFAIGTELGVLATLPLVVKRVHMP